MSYLNRVWMAATVAAVQSQPDKEHAWKSGVKSIHHGKRRFFSGRVIGSDCSAVVGGGEEEIRPSDESLRRVMYFNCWGQG